MWPTSISAPARPPPTSIFSIPRDTRSSFSCSALVCAPLKRDAALPGDEITLRQNLRLGMNFSASHANHEIENCFSHLLDGLLARHHTACVNINDVLHSPRQL